MTLVFQKKTQKNTGSFIKSTEKEIDWVVLVNQKSYYTIQFTFSELNSSKVLKLNELILLKAKILKENLNHAFQIENIDFTIKYDKVSKEYKLLAYGIDIENFTEENLKKQEIQQQAKPNMVNFQNMGGYNSNQVRSPQVQSNYQQIQVNRAYSFPQPQQQQPLHQQQQQQPILQQQQMPVDQQIQNADNLVQMFDDVIDSCKSNKDVIDSEDLIEIKKSILGYSESLTLCLNYQISEDTMDKLLKMLDKINHSVKYYDKILTREIVIDNIELGASRAIFNKQNNIQEQPKQEDQLNNNNNLLLIQSQSDSSNSGDELADPFQNKINHSYPKQPESQVMYYEKQHNQQQQMQPQQNAFSFPESKQQGNKGLFPSLPPQQIKQYPQVRLNEQLSPQPLNNSIKNNDNQSSNSKLSEDNQCIICMNDESTHTLIPCGHKKYCGNCAEEMVKQKQCAFCRKPCQQSMRIFD